MLFCLLKSELWQTPLPRLSPLSPQNWIELHDEACRQTISPLIFNAISRSTDSLFQPQLDLAARWMIETDQTAALNRKILSIQNRIIDDLRKVSLNPIVVKGQTLNQFYPDPSSRQSGDIDIFIPTDSWPRLYEYLSSRNISSIPHSDGSLSFVIDDITIEIHPRLFDIQSPLSLHRLKHHPELFSIVDTPDGIPSVGPEATLLLLSTHILKHAIGHGIGLRQLCDLALASKALQDSINPHRFQQLIKSLHLNRWTSTVYSFLVIYLDYPIRSLPYRDIKPSPLRAARLLHIIERGGNFGLHNPASISRQGKLATLRAFIKSARFSLAIAPVEALSTITSLAINSLKRKH